MAVRCEKGMDGMTLTTVKSHIKAKEFNSFYIFTGPEAEIMRLYIEKIASTYGGDIKNLDSITNLASRMKQRSVLQNRSVYVLRDCKDFLSNDELQERITQNNTFYDCIIIFVYTTIDKRSRMYKKFKDQIVEFDYMADDILVKYIQRQADLSERNCRRLVELCENDYSRILLEVDKIKRYAKAKSIADDKAFTELVDQRVIYIPPKDAVFDFVDAVLKDQPRKSFELLQESYDCGEATLVLLANLYSGAKALLQVQSYTGSGKITEATGLTPFQVKLANGRKGHFSNSELVHIMKQVRAAEKGIKAGEIEDRIAVAYVLTNIW